MAYDERFCATREMADRVKDDVFQVAEQEYKVDQQKPGAQDLAWHIRRQVSKLPTNKLLSLAVDAELLTGLLDRRLPDGRPLRSLLYDSIVQKLWPWAQ
jgi:hypothetical protein